MPDLLTMLDACEICGQGPIERNGICGACSDAVFEAMVEMADLDNDIRGQ